jgi:hypothetical protein
VHLIILAIVAVVVVAAVVAAIYNHKSIAADAAKLDAAAAVLDIHVDPVIRAAKPIVVQSIAEVDAQVAAAVAAKPADASAAPAVAAVSTPVAGQ